MHSCQDAVPWNLKGQMPGRSYISILPVELLLEIFQMVYADCSTAPASFHPLVSLSHVSKPWRDCLLNTPTFWGTIQIVAMLDKTTAMIENEIERVNIFLERSKDCPLTIHITTYSYVRHKAMEDKDFAQNVPAFLSQLEKLSAALHRHADRFFSFFLLVDEYPCTASILSSLADVPMPWLEKWTVKNVFDEMCDLEEDYLEAEEEDSHMVLLRDTQELFGKLSKPLYPNLRHVTLNSVPLHWSGFAPSNLIFLEITMLPGGWRPTVWALGYILGASANTLQKLILLTAISPDQSLVPNIVSLPCLHFLVLGFENPLELVPLLNMIEVPDLQTLVINDHFRQTLHPADRATTTPYVTETIELFRVLATRLPLSRISDVTLRHIALGPGLLTPLASFETQEEIDQHMRACTPGLDVAKNFFRSLTSVKSLLVCGPDLVTSRAVQLLCEMTSKRPSRSDFPAPRIVRICRPLEITSYLWTRLRDLCTTHALTKLIHDMPCNWYHFSQWKTLDPLTTETSTLSLVSYFLQKVEKELVIA
ncbi:hypothetical protein H0H87_000493 [Tephrocybe sp. NHM501043]|nr:hypothetical protein H0H87_000493 [Tephrocybe sp. NHM501043]